MTDEREGGREATYKQDMALHGLFHQTDEEFDDFFFIF